MRFCQYVFNDLALSHFERCYHLIYYSSQRVIGYWTKSLEPHFIATPNWIFLLDVQKPCGRRGANRSLIGNRDYLKQHTLWDNKNHIRKAPQKCARSSGCTFGAFHIRELGFDTQLFWYRRNEFHQECANKSECILVMFAPRGISQWRILPVFPFSVYCCFRL